MEYCPAHKNSGVKVFVNDWQQRYLPTVAILILLAVAKPHPIGGARYKADTLLIR
jgi:hypothetical protein